jgi:predicted RNA binding protein YcfA (HicA-like mRNA interferase family)
MTPAEVVKRPEAEGWIGRRGKGDHMVFSRPGQRFVVTVDMSAREIPVGTLRSIFRAVCWKW